MMVTDNENMFIFIIDTNEYAGNFERECTAYCTGQYGECEVGQDYARDFEIKFPKEYTRFSKIINKCVSDEHGCARPTTIWSTPGYSDCQSVAIFFYKQPTEKDMNFICKRAYDFFKNNYKNVKIEGFRLIQEIKTEKIIWQKKDFN